MWDRLNIRKPAPGATATDARRFINRDLELTSRISSDATRAMAIPEVRSKMVEAGFVVLGSTPDELGAMIARQSELVGRIVRAAKIPQTE